jgi:hypothetical protein
LNGTTVEDEEYKNSEGTRKGISLRNSASI